MKEKVNKKNLFFVEFSININWTNLFLINIYLLLKFEQMSINQWNKLNIFYIIILKLL